jgi:glutamine synthetase
VSKSCQIKPNHLRLVSREARKDGVEFLIGFESEFYLLESTDPVRVNSHHQYSEAKGLLTNLRETKALEEIVDALIDSGIKVETWHPETGHGQVGPRLPFSNLH